MFVTLFVTCLIVVAIASFSAATSSEDTFFNKLKAVVHLRNLNETNITKLVDSNTVHNANLREGNVEAENTPVRGYIQITNYNNPNTCSDFQSRMIGRIGTCVRSGKTSGRIEVESRGNQRFRVRFLDFSDGNCQRRKSHDFFDFSRNLCYSGVSFQILPEFPSRPPPGLQGSAAWLHYSRKSQCQASNIGQPIFAEIYHIGDCIEGDEDYADLKVTSCKSKEVRYHTYPTRKGTCGGKLAMRKWDNKDKCGNVNAYGEKTSFFVDHVCM